jgi:hypothetical protein
MAITDPLEYDPGTNFFGERFMEENFDEMMVGLIARVNLLMQNGGGGSGVPGETPELRVNAGWVQYKYPSQMTWTNLFEIPQDGQPGNPGTNGTNGNDGDPGAPGKSAYQVALDNGFVGTEGAWLFSLKGEDGLDGDKGDAGDSFLKGVLDFGETPPAPGIYLRRPSA